MKVYIPAHLQDRLRNAALGSELRGTFSAVDSVATITTLTMADSPSAERTPTEIGLMHSGSALTDATRPMIASVGLPKAGVPLWVTLGGETPIWRDHAGTPLEVVVFDPGHFFKRTPLILVCASSYARRNC